MTNADTFGVLIFQQLSFRAAKETLAKIRHSVGTMLNLSGMVNSNGMNDLNKSTSADKTEKELYVFLQNLGDKFDMMPMVQVSTNRKMFFYVKMKHTKCYFDTE